MTSSLFIVIFIILALPGVVIAFISLFKKKFCKLNCGRMYGGSEVMIIYPCNHENALGEIQQLRVVTDPA